VSNAFLYGLGARPPTFTVSITATGDRLRGRPRPGLRLALPDDALPGSHDPDSAFLRAGLTDNQPGCIPKS